MSVCKCNESDKNNTYKELYGNYTRSSGQHQTQHGYSSGNTNKTNIIRMHANNGRVTKHYIHIWIYPA